jgi:hypothetical protein
MRHVREVGGDLFSHFHESGASRAGSAATATLITSTITDPVTGDIRLTSLDVQWVTS